MVETRHDEFWHTITADNGGIYIRWVPMITSHLIDHSNRSVSDFTRRIYKIMQGRMVYNANEFRFTREEEIVLTGAIWLMRKLHAGQFRKSWYYNSLFRRYTHGKRPYTTHVEGVTEIFAWFFWELEIPREYFLPAIVISLFHDGVEDASIEMQAEIVVFLRTHFPLLYPEMVESLFALSHLSEDKYVKSSQVFWISDLQNRDTIEENRSKSNTIALQIHDEILSFSEGLFATWRGWMGIPHILPFRAPKDEGLPWYIASQMGEEWSAAYQLNHEFGFDVRRIRLLYRFVMHAYHVWWKIHGMPDSIAWEEDFFQRVIGDLASMLQVSLYSVLRKPEMSDDVIWSLRKMTLPEYSVLSVKIPDQIYNAWDNQYLPKMNPGEKRDKSLLKTLLISLRARFYQELLTQSFGGQNSPLHQLMRTVTERLDNVILMPLATSFQSQ